MNVAIGGSQIEEWVPVTVSQTCTGAQLASEVPQLLWETIMRDNFMDMTLKGWLWYGTLHVCNGTRSLPLKVVLMSIPEQVPR